MRKNIIKLTAAAIAASFIAAFIAFVSVQMSDSITFGGPFYTWFLAAPLVAYALVLPESPLGVFAVGMTGYFVQYFVVLGLLWASLPFARLVKDFAGSPRHQRRGLVQR